jgi:hypothetical protein
VDRQLKIASKQPIHLPELDVELITFFFFLLICSFHRNLASRVISRYLAVLAYGSFVPLMKIGCSLILLFVKSICTDLDSLISIRHFLVQIATLLTADVTNFFRKSLHFHWMREKFLASRTELGLGPNTGSGKEMLPDFLASLCL